MTLAGVQPGHGETLSHAQKAKRVRKAEVQIELEAAASEDKDEDLDLIESYENPLSSTTSSTAITINEIRVHLGFGELPVKKKEPTAPIDQRKLHLKNYLWYEYDVESEAQMKRVVKHTLDCLVGYIDSNREERCVDLSLNSFTLAFEPANLAELLNMNKAGMVAEARVFWTTTMLVLINIVSIIPMPTELLKYTIGGGLVGWIVDGFPEAELAWLLTPRIIALLLLVIWLPINLIYQFRRYVGPLTYALALFCHAVALSLVLKTPCSFAPAAFIILATLFSVAVSMSWIYIVALQVLHISMLALFVMSSGIHPTDVCPKGELDSSHGSSHP